MALSTKDCVPRDRQHRLERKRIHLVLLDEAEKGLADVFAGRTRHARDALRRLRTKRTR